MRRLLLTLAVAAAVAVVPAAQGASTLILEFTSVTTVTSPHYKDPTGKPQKGDTIDFKDLLINKKSQLGVKKGKPSAYDAGTILYTSATKAKIAGVMTVTGYGKITYRGPLVANKDGTVHVPIVNATGAFTGAKGFLKIAGGSTEVPNTYVLTLPHPLAPPGSA